MCNGFIRALAIFDNVIKPKTSYKGILIRQKKNSKMLFE